MSITLTELNSSAGIRSPVSSQQDFSLTVRLNGTGFHKTLSVTASTCIKRVTNDVPNFAPIHFLLHITRDVYVDVDQVINSEGNVMSHSLLSLTPCTAECVRKAWRTSGNLRAGRLMAACNVHTLLCICVYALFYFSSIAERVNVVHNCQPVLFSTWQS